MPLGGLYGPARNIQIVQNRDYVVIFGEYHVTTRIIPLRDDFPAYGSPKWLGNSIGKWDGDTLLVRTRNFRLEHSVRHLKSSNEFSIEGSFALLSTGEILYAYKITDPMIYSQPITAQIALQHMAPVHKLYEAACYEGNYSLPSLLAGARLQEFAGFVTGILLFIIEY